MIKVKTSYKILEYIGRNKKASPRELHKFLTIGERALYSQLSRLVSKKKLLKYGRPPQVIYTLYSAQRVDNFIQSLKQSPFKISKETQIKELIKRVPPVLNINLVVYKEGKYLFGSRSAKKSRLYEGALLFPGGRMHFDETIQDCVHRILNTEVPGLKANLRRMICAQSDTGIDIRSNNVNLYYLLDFDSGVPSPSFQFDKYLWMSKEEVLESNKIHWKIQGIFAEVDNAVKLMNVNSEEILTEVDLNDVEVGTITKRDAHNTDNRYHRAAHIVIFTSQGSVVLHQRSLNKITGPGKWDMFGGHQVSGHTIEQTAAAELSEELGIPTPLTFVRKGLNKGSTQCEWYYLYYGVSDGPYGFDRNEVAQIGIFDCAELLKGKYKEKFDILDHVYTYIHELKPVWSRLKIKSRKTLK